MSDEIIGPQRCSSCGGEYGQHGYPCVGEPPELSKRSKAILEEIIAKRKEAMSEETKPAEEIKVTDRRHSGPDAKDDTDPNEAFAITQPCGSKWVELSVVTRSKGYRRDVLTISSIEALRRFRDRITEYLGD